MNPLHLALFFVLSPAFVAARPPEGLPESLRALIERGEPTCVAMEAGGRGILTLEDGHLLYFDRSSKAGPFDAYVPGSGLREESSVKASEYSTNPAMTELIAKGRWKPCERIVVDGQKALTIPKNPPIRVDGKGARIDGLAPVPLIETGLDASLTVAYWSREVGTIFLRVRGNDDSDWMQGIAPYELGDSACLPRPRMRPAPASTPKPLDLSTKSACVAMTRDGNQAAFINTVSEEGLQTTRSLEWLGRSPRPGISLDCLTRGCSEGELTRLQADGKALGLIACPEVEALTLDGQLAPISVRRFDLELNLASGKRDLWKGAFSFDGVMTETEKPLRFWQVPGGPLFFQVRVAKQWGNGTLAKLLPIEGMGFCPADPPEVVGVLAVKASSERKAAMGYRWPATAAVDGELGTAWFPLPKKPESWLELTFAPSELVAVDIAIGEQRKDGNGDHFERSERPAKVSLSFEDGSAEEVSLDPARRGFQRVALKQSKVSSTLRITSKGLVLSEVRPVRRASL